MYVQFTFSVYGVVCKNGWETIFEDPEYLFSRLDYVFYSVSIAKTTSKNIGDLIRSIKFPSS